MLICQYYIDYYEEILPCDLPPSFRGQAVKYSYKLKIGLQRLGANVKMLHLPLRVMTWQCKCALFNHYYNSFNNFFLFFLYGKNIWCTIIPSALRLPECQDEEDLIATNPFLKKNPKDSLFDQALEAMQVSKTV